jgi:hypothetical protein
MSSCEIFVSCAVSQFFSFSIYQNSSRTLRINTVSTVISVLLMLCCCHAMAIAQDRSENRLTSRSENTTAPRIEPSVSSPTLTWWQTVRADTTFRLGGYVGLLFNSHTGGFRTLPGVPTCCSGFPAGTGTGWTVGAVARLKMFENIYGQLRVGLAQFGGSFTRSNDTIGFTIPAGGTPRAVIAEHSLSTSLLAFTIEPGIAVQPVKNLFVG